MTRTCKACKKELPDSAFYKEKTSKAGLRADCKVCVLARVKSRAKDIKKTEVKVFEHRFVREMDDKMEPLVCVRLQPDQVRPTVKTMMKQMGIDRHNTRVEMLGSSFPVRSEVHDWIEDNWEDLMDGQVVCEQFILGERIVPVASELPPPDDED